MSRKSNQNAIKDWRWRIARAGMTQKDFAAEVKVTASNLSQYILGNKNPRPLTVERIESALKKMGV